MIRTVPSTPPTMSMVPWEKYSTDCMGSVLRFIYRNRRISPTNSYKGNWELMTWSLVQAIGSLFLGQPIGDWLACWFIDCFIDRLIEVLINRLVEWWMNWLVNWLIDWLADRLVDCFINWWVDRLTSCRAVLMSHVVTVPDVAPFTREQQENFCPRSSTHMSDNL